MQPEVGHEVDGPDLHRGATTRLVLTDDDLRRITAAVKAGMAPERQAGPKGRQVLRSWAAPLVGFAILLAAWWGLTHWRPAIDPRVQASALPATEVLQYTPDNRNVQWTVNRARVQSLTVGGVHSIGVLVDLPIPATTEECLRLARELGGDCSTTANTVLVTSPATVSWSSPQSLSLIAPGGDRTVPRLSRAESLTVTMISPEPSAGGESGPPAGQPGQPAVPPTTATPAAQSAPELSIWARVGETMDSPSWCFEYAPPANATLSIVTGKVSRPRVLTPESPHIACTGLKLSVLPGLTTAQMGSGTGPVSPLITLAGIAGVQVQAKSTDVTISGLAGRLVLEEDRVKVFDTPVAASIHAEEPIETTFGIQGGRPTLALVAENVENIDTGEGNLVRTAWQRQKELALPILLGLVGLMTPLLGAAYRNTFDYLMGQPTLLISNLRRLGRWLWWPIAAPVRLVRRLGTRRRRPPSLPPTQA